ncbi:CARDB domain-containing protein [Dyadobacter sediminis]|uniref:CARDB domain-containing protein n=1 Tax=Dyadobacter sediminis TaxID=1493691 RepID=UPI0014867F1E|nr:CARDB domain-containing protein [Dyadobacter sediminis]
MTFTVTLNESVKKGMHRVFVRARDTDGNWSLVHSHIFFKEVLEPGSEEQELSNISKVEYFIDHDPGYGKGTNVALTASKTIKDLTFSVPLSESLVKGLHRLFVRARDAKGNWSFVSNQLFYKEILQTEDEEQKLPNITKLEYFIDKDPGYGKAINVAVTGSKIIKDLDFMVPLSGSLSKGLHRLFVRAMDANGKWSFVSNQLFHKEVLESGEGQSLPNIVKAEYFIDQDPGYDKAKNVPVTAGKAIKDLTFSVPLIESLAKGLHRLFIRTKDSRGKWSLVTNQLFYKEILVVSEDRKLPDVNRLEYFIDKDLGYGKGTNVPVTPGKELNDISFDVPVDKIELGDHILYVRARDANGKWSIVQNSKFRVEPPTGIFVTVGTIDPILCTGSPLNIPFTVNSPFSEGNTFTAQLSDMEGSFESPRTIGTLKATGSGTIEATVPYVRDGSNYRIRIVSDNPERTSVSNNLPLRINHIPSVFSIAGDTVSCLGEKAYSLNNYERGSGNYIWSLSGGGDLDPSENLADITWKKIGLHTVTVKYTGVCAGDDSVKVLDVRVIDQPLTGTFKNLLPKNEEIDLPMPVTFSWSPISNAESYDVYIWPEGKEKPEVPAIANVKGINHTVSNSNIIQYEQLYKWQVVAKRACYALNGPVQTFRTRKLPDLIVQSMTVPATAITETEMTVSWTIKNQGDGGTNDTPWNDHVYLSDQPTLSTATEKFNMGTVENFSALAAGQSYQSVPFKFKVPQGIQGNYYVVVTTNESNSFKETDNTNNQKVSAAVKVSLAPPPDLQVTALTVSPLSAFSEGEITINYTVTNKGPGPTTASNWTDLVLIGTSETVNMNTDLTLSSYGRNKALPADSSYTISQKVNLPQRIEGTYYVHVVTDRYSQVFEYNQEDNNSRASLPMTIIQKPTPNLQINDLSLSSASASSGQNITVSWTTSNQGSLEALPGWNEAVYISAEKNFDPDKTLLITSFWRTDTLQSLASSRVQHVVQVPATLPEGSYYFYIVTDANDRIYENPGEDDNVSPASEKVMIGNPDLKPVSLINPATALSEQSITMQWKVKNESGAAIYTNSWTDRIYLSVNETLEVNDVLLTSSKWDQFLVSGGEYTRNESVTLPANLSGKFFLILAVDESNTIFEKEENNNIVSAPITLSLAPWADLEVVTVPVPAADTLGTVINLQYVVKNSGSGNVTNKTWTDGIYLSATADVDEKALISLGSVVQNRRLASGQSYTQQTSFTLTGNLPAGNYFTVIKADMADNVFENGAENNNINRSVSSTALVALPETDLFVTSGQILSTTVTAGRPVSLKWTVKNNSKQLTAVPFWTDAVYLSNNPVLDASDVQLGSLTITSPLGGEASYTRNLSVNVPEEAGGKMFFIIHSDRFGQLNDKNRSNNVLAMTLDGGGNAVEVVTPPPADLVPLSFTAPNQGIASQPVTITFKVKNTGTGTTPSEYWTDQVFLSADDEVGNDISIVSTSRTIALAPGEEYSHTVQAFLPANQSGNFYLLFKTDSYNNVFERGKENNNVAAANIFISPQQPTDLIVKEVTVPAAEQYAGENVRIGWTVANAGTNKASGFLRDAVYISKDDSLDIADVLLGTLESNIDLSVQDTAKMNLQKQLTNLAAGEYFVIVKTDILDNLLEQNENNNQAVSAGKIKIAVRQLEINKLTSAKLGNNNQLYYQLVIPANLSGETLAITLKGDSLNKAVNRLFVQRDSVPTANKYEFVAAAAFQANQELIIPALKTGTYYIMANGSADAFSTQDITLLATIIPFGIKTVDAASGGNTGLATLKITGARFEAGMTFRLKKSSEYIQPYKVQFVNQTLVYATFNLLNKPLGLYDMEAVRPGGTVTVLPKAFTIKQGPGNIFAAGNNGSTGASSGFVCTISNVGFEDQLGTDIITPANARLSVVTSFIVSFQNNGSVDIPAPTKYLLSLNEDVPIAFTIDQLKENKNDLVLECKEADGPFGILRPGASGFFKIYTVSHNRTVPSIDLVITE